jgi:ferredoxin-NADP reductase
MDSTSAPKERAFDTFETTVDDVQHVTPRNVHLRFRLPSGKHMKFKAGQFVQIFVPQPDKPRRTSYSIASSPEHDDFFELCVTHVEGGKSSTYLHQLKVGDKVTVMGPLGKFSYPVPLEREPVFIATGSGIAPLRSMIYDLLHKNFPKNIHLIYGNRFDDDIIYKSEWDELSAEHKNFKVTHTLSKPTDKWKGEKGYVGEKIEKAIPDPKSKDYFICGLSNMINDVQAKLLSLGVPKEQIHYEKYD